MLARLAAEHDLAALLARALDKGVHALAVRLRDQRAHLRLGVERVAHLQLPRLLGERADEVVVDRLLDEDARPCLAALAGRVVDRPDCARERRVEVGVGKDEIRALAAELGVARRLIGSEQSRMISPPVFVEPVKATLSTPGCLTR